MSKFQKMPRRYHLAWKRGTEWKETLRCRIPKHLENWVQHGDTIRFEDMQTGQVLRCNFDLIEQTWFATHPERFPKLIRGRRGYGIKSDDTIGLPISHLLTPIS